MNSSEVVTPEMVGVLGLADVLRSLGLSHAAGQLDESTKKAIARSDSPLSLLDGLMREELRARTEARARIALKRSQIFPITTLDSYDFDFPKQIDRVQVERAATLDFVREKTNVVFVGPSGVGKTHLANALGLLAATRGYRVRFVLAADLVNDLVARQARNTLHRGLHQWSSYDLLLVDELGYLRAPTCSTRSSTSATSEPRPSSRRTSRSKNGRSSSTTRRPPRRSPIGSSTRESSSVSRDARSDLRGTTTRPSRVADPAS